MSKVMDAKELNRIASMIVETFIEIELSKAERREWDRAVLKCELGPRKYWEYLTSKNQKGLD